MKLFLYFFSIGFLFITTASADDNSRGRLADGRAFRTDAQGNQLVDYIAELELSVETLNRRVQGLETELADKQKVVERIERGDSAKEELVERNLLHPEQERPVAAVAVVADPPSCVKEERELARLTQLLDAMKDDLEVERQLHAKDTSDYQTKLAALNSTLNDRSAELSELQVKFNNSAERAHPTLQAPKMIDHPAPQLPTALALKYSIPEVREQKPEEPAEPVQIAVPDEELRPVVRIQPISSARLRAVESLKGSISTELNKLSSLIATRDKLYRAYQSTSRRVSFKPARAISSRNETPDIISKRIRAATSAQELSALSRSISEIRNKLQDDIALMDRMKRVG